MRVQGREVPVLYCDGKAEHLPAKKKNLGSFDTAHAAAIAYAHAAQQQKAELVSPEAITIYNNSQQS